MASQQKKIGNQAEKQALHYLKSHQLSLITTNYFTKFGEIDIIMLDKQNEEGVLVFIEVRYRKNIDYGHGFETITRHKQQKIIRSAKIFLLNYPKYNDFICRFDVISLKSDLKYTNHSLFDRWRQMISPYKLDIDWIKNAFDS